jgi:hypothetical protein
MLYLLTFQANGFQEHCLCIALTEFLSGFKDWFTSDEIEIPCTLSITAGTTHLLANMRND